MLPDRLEQIVRAPVVEEEDALAEMNPQVAFVMKDGGLNQARGYGSGLNSENRSLVFL